jgi:hypothetical protein
MRRTKSFLAKKGIGLKSSDSKVCSDGMMIMENNISQKKLNVRSTG